MTNAEFVELIKRNPVRVISGVVAVLCAASVYYLSDQIDIATQALAQKTAEGERLATNVKFSAQLPEQLEALTTANAAIQARAVQASQLANNLQYFYRLETESGVELVDLRQTTGAGRVNAKASSNGVGFAISVKGDYPTLLGWLRRLENGPHFCRVMTASMGLAGVDRAAPPVLAISVELFGQP